MPEILSKQTKIGRCVQELIAAMQFDKNYHQQKGELHHNQTVLYIEKGFTLCIDNQYAIDNDIILPEVQ